MLASRWRGRLTDPPSLGAQGAGVFLPRAMGGRSQARPSHQGLSKPGIGGNPVKAATVVLRTRFKNNSFQELPPPEKAVMLIDVPMACESKIGSWTILENTVAPVLLL